VRAGEHTPRKRTEFHVLRFPDQSAPAGFITGVGSVWSSIPAIERLDRPVYSVPFHAERYDADHARAESIQRNVSALTNDAAPGVAAAG
jgi:hypothetical protein